MGLGCTVVAGAWYIIAIDREDEAFKSMVYVAAILYQVYANSIAGFPEYSTQPFFYTK